MELATHHSWQGFDKARMVTIRLKVSPEVFFVCLEEPSCKTALIVVRIASLCVGAWIAAPSVRSESFP